MKKFLGIASVLVLATVLTLPVLAETREVAEEKAVEDSNYVAIEEVEEVQMLKATPDNATPDDAEPMYAYLYGQKITHEYVAWMYPELAYPHRYCLFHDNPNDIWYVCDLETGRIYTDGFFGDDSTGCGFRFDHDNVRNLPTLIKKAPTVWCERNWQVLCITKWGNE